MTREGLEDRTGIRLRPMRDDDRERLLEMLQDPDQLRWGSPAFLDVPSDIEALADRITESQEAWAEGRPGALAVAGTDDRLLGDISWRWAESERMAVADIGYVVHPDSRGRGVGRRAILLLTRWLMDPDGRGLVRVQLDHSTENEASCRVALAAGFEREGVRQGFLPLRGADGVVRHHDVCLHGRVVRPTV